MTHHDLERQDGVAKEERNVTASRSTSFSHDRENEHHHGEQHDHDEEHEEHEEHEEPEPLSIPTNLGDVPDDQPPGLDRTVSVQSRPISLRLVPTSNRAGLFARFSLVYEADNPIGFPRKIKWLITFVIAIAAVAAPMGSAIILPALNEITLEFNTTPTIANLSVAMYMLAMSIFPLWWSAFSEAAGRRTVYICSFTILILWNVLAAVSTSISMFIVMRILSGGAAAAVQAVGAGTIADIWEVKERGKAMGIFYLGPLCGPLLSPIIGGALTEGFGWRSTQWFQTIYGGVTLILVVLLLPETHKQSSIVAKAEAEAIEDVQADAEKTSGLPSIRPSLSRTTTRQSVAKHSRKHLAMARRILIDPLEIIKYLRFPAVALTVYYASIAFGSLYFLNISIEKTFSAPPYNFNVIIIGCLYIFNSVGYIVASIFGGRWVDYIMHREARKAGRIDARGKLHFRPEDRMGENAWMAGFMMPAALLWYGWTANYGVYWLAPMVANFFFGIGSMLLFAAATTMLTEFMPKKASNGVALNNFCRNIFSFLGTFLAEPLINAIGNGWLFTILGIVCLVSCFVIVLMKKYGEKWHAQMDEEMN